MPVLIGNKCSRYVVHSVSYVISKFCIPSQIERWPCQIKHCVGLCCYQEFVGFLKNVFVCPDKASFRHHSCQQTTLSWQDALFCHHRRRLCGILVQQPLCSTDTLRQYHNNNIKLFLCHLLSHYILLILLMNQIIYFHRQHIFLLLLDINHVWYLCLAAIMVFRPGIFDLYHNHSFPTS